MSRRSNEVVNDFLPHWVDFEMMQIYDYIDEQEHQFDSKGKDLENKFHQLQKDIKEGKVEAPREYHSYLESSLIDEMWQIDTQFKHFFRQSIVIQLYSLLESKLKYGCDNYASQKKTDYKMRDLKGSSDMDKAKLFMTRTMGITIKDLEPEWGFIQRLRKTRNVIVHHNSELLDSHRDFKEINAFEQKGFELECKTSKQSDISEPQHYALKFTDKAFLQNVSKNITFLLHKIGNHPVK